MDFQRRLPNFLDTQMQKKNGRKNVPCETYEEDEKRLAKIDKK